MTESTEVYWLRRQVANEAKAVNYAEAKLRELGRHYRKATKSIDDEIATFYRKYSGADGKIDMAKVSMHVRSNLTRLDELKQRVQRQLGEVTARETQIAKRTLSEVYTDARYRSQYELQRFRANYRDVERLSPAHVDRAISTAWSGRSYSTRIWGRHQRLTHAVDEIITQGVVLGHSNERMARQLAERMQGSYSNAKRLVRTETNFVYNQGTLEGYRASGIEEYEFVSTLDMRTSDVCQRLDGKRYKLSEAQPGRNYPPMHPNCRSTTVPAFADDEDKDVGERFARDADGKGVLVRGDMTYPEWQKQYISPETPGHDTIESNFLSVITDTPSKPPGFDRVLADRYAAAPAAARAALDKYVRPNPVKDATHTDGAYYHALDKAITMDIRAEMANPRGQGATFYHELGHYIDHAAAMHRIGEDTLHFASHVDLGTVKAGAFRKAILQDVDDYLRRYASDNGLTPAQARVAIKTAFSGSNSALYSAVSDLYGGASGNALRGHYGHAAAYWRRPAALEKEAFAHMFEASFDAVGDRRKLMETYFPTAFKLFHTILEVI